MPTRRAVTTLLEITGIMVMASWLTHLAALCGRPRKWQALLRCQSTSC